MNLQAEIHRKLLAYRAMDRLLAGPRFREAFDLDANNPEVKSRILSGDVSWVENWISETLKAELDLSEMTLRHLRLTAAKIGIPRYVFYTKDELIVRIAHARQAQKVAV